MGWIYYRVFKTDRQKPDAKIDVVIKKPSFHGLLLE